MTPKNYKDIEMEMNSVKDFEKAIHLDALRKTQIIATRLKDPVAAGKIVKAAHNLASIKPNIPHIAISRVNPMLHITYPNDTNRKFVYGTKIPLTMYVEDVKFPYTLRVFAQAKGKATDLVLEQGVKSDKHTIPDILLNVKLPAGHYEILAELYHETPSGRQNIKNWLGLPVVEKAAGELGIEILPTQISGDRLIPEKAASGEPSVIIRYPWIGEPNSRKIEEGKPFPLVYETHNVPFPYQAYVYATSSSGQKIALYVDRNRRFEESTIPDICVHHKLPAGHYDINIIIYQNYSTNQILNSKGQPVVDRACGQMGIDIVPATPPPKPRAKEPNRGPPAKKFPIGPRF